MQNHTFGSRARALDYLAKLPPWNQPGFSKEEKEEARIAIYANILDSIVALLEAMTGKLGDTLL